MNRIDQATSVDEVGVEFSASDGSRVGGRLALVEVRGNGDVRLTLHVDPYAAGEIRSQERFHLTADASDAADMEFGGPGPVEMVLGAGPALAGELPVDAAEILDAFHSGRVPPEWQEEANWQLLSLSQAIDLPPELDTGSGQLRKGFETVWAQQRRAAAGLFDVVRSVVDGWEFPFEELELDGYPVLHLEAGTKGPWDCYLIVKRDRGQVGFYSVRPDLVAAEQRPAVMELVTRANYGLELANFEMDLDDGEVRLKSVLLVDGPDAAAALLDRLVAENLALLDQYRAEVDAAAG